MAGRNYRDLVVWQEGMDLCVEIYRATDRLPADERYGLRSQMRSAAVSIPANSAAGQGRRSSGDFRLFLSVAHGSTRELETQVLLSGKLGCLDTAVVERLMSCLSEVGRLTTALSASLKE